MALRRLWRRRSCSKKRFACGWFLAFALAGIYSYLGICERLILHVLLWRLADKEFSERQSGSLLYLLWA